MEKHQYIAFPGTYNEQIWTKAPDSNIGTVTWLRHPGIEVKTDNNFFPRLNWRWKKMKKL